MNADRPRPWTPVDLELYHDDELAPDERAALTEALRQDAGLRRDYLAVRDVLYNPEPVRVHV